MSEKKEMLHQNLQYKRLTVLLYNPQWFIFTSRFNRTLLKVITVEKNLH